MLLFTDASEDALSKPWQRAFLLAGTGLFLTLIYWSLRAVLLYTTDIGGVEANVVYGIGKLLRGLPLYEDPERPPFDVVQYTPLYYYLAAGIGWLIGVDPTQPQQVFMLSRLISLACNLGTVLATYRIIRRTGAAPWLALFWSMLMFATITRHFYSRTDSLYLLLFTVSMGLFLTALGHPPPLHRRQLAWATIVACLSLLTKQSGILALLIIGLYLLWQRRWRDLFTQVGISMALLALAFGALGLHYGGHVLYQNVVTGLKNGFSLEIFEWVFFTRRYLTIVVFHVLGGILAWRMMRGADPMRQALGLAIVTSFLFALITGLKSGSRLNYFLENFLLIFLAIPSLFAAPRVRIPRFCLPALMAYALLHFTMGMLRLRTDVVHIRGKHGRSQYAKAAAVDAYLRKDRQLAEGQYVFIIGRDFLEQFLIGHGVLDQKDIVQYSPPDLYDRSEFYRAMTDGRVRFVISQGTPGIFFLGRSYTCFTPVDTLAGHIIYEHDRFLR
ncbi:MAG: hypothetical protein JST66_14070 [Bacteroidetes bacterium]|nr:hypothetical protein [Bacteroidota bacterium]